MTNAAIYCRISKDDEGTELGVQRQERLCRELAARRGVEVVETYRDNDISAFSGKRRPGFEALLAAVEDGKVSTIVCYHVDRLYRRALELEGLVSIVERTKAEVLTVAAGDLDLSTASGRHVARILGATAQAEAERLSERLKVKSDELAAAGRPPGGRPPYGYAAGYVVEDAEAKWVRHAADRALAGWSLVRIARELDDLGVPTRQGKPWHHSTVRNVLVNPAIAGLRVHRREVAGPGAWEPVLDRDAWERLRATLADPRRRKVRSGGPYLLSGLVRSPSNTPMNGSLGRDGADYTTRSGHHTFTLGPDTIHASVKARPLEAYVVEAVLEATDGRKLQAAADEDDGAVSSIEAELDELARLRGEGVIDMSEWLAAREPLRRRLNDARKALGPQRPVVPVVEDLRAEWERLDDTQRQQAVQALVERVVVAPVGGNRHVPIADRVTIDWRA